MKAKLIIFLLLAVSACLAQKRYYRGNTHTHSYPQSSDAATTWTPATIVAGYKAAGYDFIVFTDHVAYWNANSLSSPDLTVISGEEAGLSGSGRWGHFTAMKIRSQIGSTGKTHQQLLDEIASQGGLAFLNHPRWSVIPISAGQVINDMKQNLRHVEVYNWNTDTPTTFDTSLWDSVLTSGRILFGVASDDAHKESHLGKGWICVYASSKHPDTLFNAIRNGEFYASNGIVLDSIGYRPDRILVRSVNGSLIRFIGSGGGLLATFASNEAVYNINGNEGYVRAEITNGLNQTAWIQPFMIPRSTAIDRNESFLVPESPTLFQNYPNPFNPSTSFKFHLPAGQAGVSSSSAKGGFPPADQGHEWRAGASDGGLATLKIYDVLGREVATLLNEMRPAGVYTIRWDASSLPSGVYFYRLSSGEFVETKKMVFTK